MTTYNETPYRDKYWLIAVEQVEPYRFLRDSAEHYVHSGEHFDSCRTLTLTLNTWLELYLQSPKQAVLVVDGPLSMTIMPMVIGAETNVYLRQ